MHPADFFRPKNQPHQKSLTLADSLQGTAVKPPLARRGERARERERKRRERDNRLRALGPRWRIPRWPDTPTRDISGNFCCEKGADLYHDRSWYICSVPEGHRCYPAGTEQIWQKWPIKIRKVSHARGLSAGYGGVVPPGHTPGFGRYGRMGGTPGFPAGARTPGYLHPQPYT